MRTSSASSLPRDEPEQLNTGFLEVIAPVSKNLRKDLESVLRDLEQNAGDVEGSAIVRTDGLVIAFAMPKGVDESLVAAMSAALLSIGTRTVRELARGDLEKVIVSAAKGDLVLMGAGADTVLSVTTKYASNLGLVLVSMKRTISRIGQLISGSS